MTRKINDNLSGRFFWCEKKIRTDTIRYDGSYYHWTEKLSDKC